MKDTDLKRDLELPDVQLFKIQINKGLISWVSTCKTSLKAYVIRDN